MGQKICQGIDETYSRRQTSFSLTFSAFTMKYFFFFCPFLLLGNALNSASYFNCILGEPCTLELFEMYIPQSPMIRISTAACGSSDAGSIYSVTFPVNPRVVLDPLTDISLTGTVLTICLASATAPDPNFSVSWTTINMIGPIAQNFVVYAGSDFSPSLPGNLIESIKSVLYYTPSLTACSPTVGSPMYGLNNVVASVREPSSRSSPYQFRSLGIVDPTLSSNVQLTICWSASPNLFASRPVIVGTVSLVKFSASSLTNPFSCVMGFRCTLIFSAGATAGSIIIPSTANGCYRESQGLVWGNSQTAATYDATFSGYDFNILTQSGNGYTVRDRPVCYRQSLTDPFHLLPIGTITLFGPSDGTTGITNCISGEPCMITIPGLFDHTMAQKLELRESSCAGAIATLNPDGSTTNVVTSVTIAADPTATTLVLSISKTFGPINYAPTEYANSHPIIVICWSPGTGSAIQAGRIVSLRGPSAVSPSCSIGRPCYVDFQSTITDNSLNQIRLIEFNPSIAPADPCASIGSSTNVLLIASGIGVYDSGLVRVKIPRITKAIRNSAWTRGVCWNRWNTPGTPVLISPLFSLSGPPGDIAVTCTIGEVCNVLTIDP